MTDQTAPTIPVTHAIYDHGHLSTVHNGHRWETAYFSVDGHSAEMPTCNGVEDAAALAARLNCMGYFEAGHFLALAISNQLDWSTGA